MDREEYFDYNIHASKLVEYAVCPKRFLSTSRQLPPPKSPVSAWIGSCVHARVAGKPEPQYPFEIQLDRITPSKTIAIRQIGLIATAIEKFLHLKGLRITEWELNFDRMPVSEGSLYNTYLTGSADAKGSDPDNRSFLLDIKTGSNRVGLETYMLQMGAYRALDKYMTGDGVKELIILHAPRSEDILAPPPVSWYKSMNPKEAEEHALKLAREIGSGNRKMRAIPGTQCKNCEVVTCGLRIERFY